MRSLTVRKMNSARTNPRDPDGPKLGCALCVRTHDLGGTDHELICYLTEAQAEAISGPGTGITMDRKGSREQLPLEITRVTDREPHTLAWTLSIGGDVIARIDDDKVRALRDLGNPVFEPGQPNWETRQVEIIDDEIATQTERLEKLHARRAELIAVIEQESPAP